MPQQLTPETRERYTRALAMRDNGATFREIAQVCGYADPATARYAWIGGLRLAGRHVEIPTRTPRRIGVTLNNGRTTRVLTVDTLESWSTTSTLTFGIEIECVGLYPRRAAEALRNAGITCVDAGYTHQRMTDWKVVTDGSLSGRNGSCEVVSPVLRGSDGLAEVRTVMKVLREAGAHVNQSCGMHVHVGVDHLTRKQQANIIRAYHGFQWAMTAWIRERRINNSWAKFRSYEDSKSLADHWEQYGPSTAQRENRYYALNVASFARHGTFEFRAHHGSLNGTSAAAWVALQLAFIEKVCAMVSDHEARLALLATPEQRLAAETAFREEMLWAGDTQFYTGAWHYGMNDMRRTDIGGAVIEHVENNTRESARHAAHGLVSLLFAGAFLAADVSSYLRNRACNIPSNRSRNA